MRRFLSFIIALCLVSSLFVIPASSAAAGTVGTAGGFDAVSSILFGLGLSVDSVENFSAWNDVVTASQEYLSENGFIDTDGNISTLSSSGKTFLPLTILQTVHDWFFTSGSIFSSPPYQISTTLVSCLDGTVYTLSSDSPIYVYYLSQERYNGNMSYDSIALSSSIISCSNGSEYNGKFDIAFTSGSVLPYDLPYFYLGKCAYQQNLLSEFLSSWSPATADPNYIDGITSSDVPAVFGQSIEENYPAWYADAITSPPITLPGGTEEDDPIPYVPVSIQVFNSSSSTIPLQSDIWTGQDTSTSDDDPDDIPIAPDISTDVSDINTGVQDIAQDAGSLASSAVEWFTTKWEAFTTWLEAAFTRVIELIDAIPGLIVAAVEAVAATVTSIWEWLKETLAGLLEQIIEALGVLKAWALGLIDALEALLVKIFVPDLAAIEAAVADLRAQFPFFDSIIATGQYIHAGISSGSPPVIYMHLEDAEGSLAWGGTVAALDMSFYSRYKPAGDLIMSSALITVFAWHTFKRLPGIISGAGSDVEVLKEL